MQQLKHMSSAYMHGPDRAEAVSYSLATQPAALCVEGWRTASRCSPP